VHRREVLVVAAALALLAGCGGEPQPDAPPASGAFNDTDVMFLQMMLAHHAPAAELLRLGRSHATREQVRALAADLAAAQAGETRMMTGWLRGWDRPLISDVPADLHAAHGGLPLLDEAEVAALGALNGAAFDTAFLNVLIGHEHTAVDLARMEADGGSNPQVRDLAKQTDEQVRARIGEMLRMVAAPAS
jgi:uncharacterized protein (DUF305 family)